MFLTQRQHKGFGILFFIWGLGCLIVCLMVPFILINGVNNTYNKQQTDSNYHSDSKMTEADRDNYLNGAKILRWITLGAGGLLWILSAFNILSWKIKEKREAD